MTDAQPYRVLARKYRPKTFAELIGQEALVRTLAHAIAAGRLAHAFMLTGVRGVGKTTTARILARAINCVGADGQGGATVSPCGVCDHCKAILDDRHVDIFEFDAASRTGVDDVREIIDGVRYRPVSARYKVYIIDEVHMLSRNAFNALLKTLEEPPEHTKFIFATTELRKVPVTVLSRCQRFDLRRVESSVLETHFTRIAAIEGSELSPAAARLIARAADGSVRDGLSLLDQAIARAPGRVEEEPVRQMLGLADRGRLFDLMEQTMRGDMKGALAILDDMHAAGADPVVVLQDLLDLTHWLTRLRLAPDAADPVTASELERVRGMELARALAIPVLTRAWQILLKGVQEAAQAPDARAAADMVLVRLAFVADLPSPADLIRKGAGGEGAASPRGPGPGSGGPGPGSSGGAGPRAALAPTPAPTPTPALAPSVAMAVAAMPGSFADLVALFQTRREAMLAMQLTAHVHLVSYAPGVLVFRPAAGAARDLVGRLGKLLEIWTGQVWQISTSTAQGAPLLRDQQATVEADRQAVVRADPRIAAVLKHWPEAKITAIRPLKTLAPETLPATMPDDLDESGLEPYEGLDDDPFGLA